jgi:hypothetical protein
MTEAVGEALGIGACLLILGLAGLWQISKQLGEIVGELREMNRRERKRLGE